MPFPRHPICKTHAGLESSHVFHIFSLHVAMKLAEEAEVLKGAHAALLEVKEKRKPIP